MRLLTKVFNSVLLMLLCTCFQANAQGSSINAYSPYTFYGIGDINTPGTALMRSMGGTNVALRNGYIINYLNPASFTSMGPNTFLMNIGMEGQNFYESTSTAKTSFNTFNIRNVALAFPITRKLGFGFSMTPFSSVGYTVKSQDTSDDVLSDIGIVNYIYQGSGGVSQFKAGLGYKIHDNVSLGVDLVYYQGTINRDFSAEFTPITSGGVFMDMKGYDTERISKVLMNFGIQANLISNDTEMLTVGAMYQMGGDMNVDVSRYIPSSNLLADTITHLGFRSDFELASTYGVGVFLHKQRYSLGMDYEFSDWGRRNASDKTSTLSFRNTHTIRVGGQITPNRGDVRNFLKRWTYRAGLRYANYYMILNGEKLNDKAVTLGVGVPIRMAGLTNINIGLEYGQRGTTKSNLVKENYFKVSVGLSLFGEDSWFVKFKYD